MSKIILIIVILSLFFTSIGLKADRYLTRAADIQGDSMERLTQFMDSHDFLRVGKRPLTYDASFSEYLFTHPTCEKPLKIIPLYESSQASSLAYMDRKRTPLFIYKNHMGHEFPTFSYWKDQIIGKQSMFPAVLAVHAAEKCKNITWNILWKLDS